MFLGFGLSITNASLQGTAIAFALSAKSEASTVTLGLSEVFPGFQSDSLSLTSLTLDGMDVLSSLSPDTAATAVDVNIRADGLRAAGGVFMQAADASIFTPGSKWLAVYDIMSTEATGLPFAPASSPFSPNNASFPIIGNLGRNTVLLTVSDSFSGTGQIDLLRSGSGGGTTFANLALYRAEWSFSVEDRGPEVASNTAPGLLEGSGGQSVVSPSEPLEIGARYELFYTISAADAGVGLFIPGSTAFDGNANPPATVGTHKVVLTCQSTSTSPFLRKSGSGAITVTSMSLKKLTQAAGRVIIAQVNDERPQNVFITRDVHVATTGDDIAGTGTQVAPFATPQRAADLAAAGDTIYLAAGTYEPFLFPDNVSGTAQRPIKFTTSSGDVHQAIIDGQNFDIENLSGVEINNSSHVHVTNLTVQNCTQNGILVDRSANASYEDGIDGTITRGYVIQNNVVRRTGQAGIQVQGWRARDLGWLPPNTLRILDVLIADNDVSYTNMPTPYNGTNSQGVTGGVNECVTVVGCVGNVETRNNDIHDSRQYGIDYKNGVIGGSIHGNRIWNIMRYGIYIDTSLRETEDIDVYENQIWGCNIGITLAREAGGDKTEPWADFANAAPSMRNVSVRSNQIHDCENSGIFIAPHPGDVPAGSWEQISITDNAVYNCARDGSGNEIRLVDLTPLTDPAHPNGNGVSLAVVSDVVVSGNVVWRDPGRGDPSAFDEWSAQPWCVSEDNINFEAPFSDPNFASLPSGTAQDVTDAEAAGYITPALYGQFAVGDLLAVNPGGLVEGDDGFEEWTLTPYKTEANGEGVILIAA